MNTAILDSALAYARAGLSVIPVGKAKRPALKNWKQYESNVADADTVKRFFANGANVAIITGAVSGGLLAIDFDDPRFFDAWRERVGDLAEGLVVQRTGRGFHVLCRCPDPGGNQKLAFIPDDDELSGRRAAIETRAEGGYFLAAPSIHETGKRYEVIAGDLTAIPTISQAHADALLSAARALDECPLTRQQKKREAKAQPRPAPSDGGSVIEFYNAKHAIEAVLESYGYRVKGARAIRPGGEHLSITIHEGKSFHHNTSDPLADGYWQSPFSVFCKLEHGGDVKAAVRAAAESLGMRAERKTRRAATESIAPIPQPSLDAGPDSLPFNLTDLGNAERLAAHHGEQLNFVRVWGWLVWSGKHWARDEGAAWRLAKETVRGIYAEAELGRDEDERAAIASWAMRSESEGRLSSMLALAESESGIEARPETFDSDPLLLNCTNGTLDLRTATLRPHNSADRLTRLSSTAYEPEATCPIWESFLDRVMSGNKALISFLRRAVGYSLTGDTGEQCLFFCYGTGANGKSVFLETIRALLGDYAQAAEFSTFLAKQNDAVRNDIARMSGTRFIAAIEAGEGRRLNEPVIKALTGGDTVTARYLYREFFEFHPQFKLWLAANHKPIIRGTDTAIWRRIRLIPFTVTIPEGERDPKLAAKLRAELTGILAWAVRGCLEWQSAGLRPPAEVRAATDEYRAEMDTLAAFVDECCIVALHAEVKAADLYAAYKAWAELGSEYVENQRAFGLRLSERGFKPDRSTGGVRVWRGIGLLEK
jgi:putative DNA primase/helicase